MSKKGSKLAFISSVLGSCYLFFFIIYFLNVFFGINMVEQSAVFSSLNLGFLTLHMIFLVPAVILNWLTFFISSKPFSIICTSLYTISVLTIIFYISFMVIVFDKVN